MSSREHFFLISEFSQAKRELARKEGRLLTKKQKEEKARAEVQRQALIASGVQIEGLQQISGNGIPARKLVYGSRKKKAPVSKEASQGSDSQPISPEPEAALESEVQELQATDDGIKDEALEDIKDEDVKDEWDATSSEDEIE